MVGLVACLGAAGVAAAGAAAARRTWATAASENEARAEALGQSTADAVVTIDGNGCIKSLNWAAEALFGYAAGEAVGRSVEHVIGLSSVPLNDRDGRGDCAGWTKDGAALALDITVTSLRLGNRSCRLVVARDATERHTAQRDLAHQGTHDPLTALPNRLLFLDRLSSALARAFRSGKPLAVLFCDLDHFKVVNDSLGHSVGDELLSGVATRFCDAVRATDTVARFGGDEFVILIEDLANEDDAKVVADQLAATLSAPMAVRGQELHMTASIGIAVTNGAATPDELLRDADAAMYRAKQGGRDRYELFDADLRRQAVARLETEGSLRRALRGGELIVYYQPEIALDTGSVVGVEALVRWRQPDGRLASPEEFLSVAEETGLIVPMGEAVLQEACQRAASWHRFMAPGAAPALWVNVSVRQLAAPGLVPMLASAVETWLPAPGALGLEITETDLVPDDERIRRAVAQVDELGVRIAMDDFGTGFASLAYLWRFPASTVKIDRSFVQRLGDERQATVIIASMIQLARSLDQTTVAEGVETEAQLSRLRRLGCDAAQGFLLARPGPAEAIDELLLTQRCEPPPVPSRTPVTVR